jgi:prepilin-type N-terminal cleavage/methylation domain-containing protein
MTRRPEHRQPRHRDDDGFTLVEAMVVLVAFAVLIAITVPIVSTVLQTTSRVRATYTNVNDQLSLSTNLQRLLRVAVAPAPSFHGSTPLSLATPPRTPFAAGAITPTSLTFFVNTGTVKGPEEVTASCTQTATNKTRCAPAATFTLEMVPAKATSCPFNETSTTTCAWTTTSTRTLLVIPHVTNGDRSPAQPLFTYTYSSATGSQTVPTATVSTVFSKARCGTSASGTSDHPFGTCAAGEIDEVSYDLSFNAIVTKSTAGRTTPRDGGFQTQTVSGAFVMSPTTVLYSPAVG